MRPGPGYRLVVATHNAGKLAEIAALLGPLGVELLSAADLGLPEPAETETTFEGNARIKAYAAHSATGLPALADDSGLCVEALNGAPGVWSADWAQTDGGRDFDVAMQRVHAALASKPQPWTAHFRSTVVLQTSADEVRVFSGVLSGQVVWPGRGASGHGYDPIFQPDGMDRTVAELAPDEKNAISHRGRALHALISSCFT